MSDQQEVQALYSNLGQARNLLDKINPTNPTATKTTTPTNPSSTPTSSITKLPSFAERGAAIGKKLENIKNDPRYKALSPQKQEHLRAKLYKEIVPASYAGFHLPVPDEKTWVEASGRETAYAGEGEKLSETYKDSRAMQMAEDFGVGVNKTFNNITMFGAQMTNKAFSAAFGLDSHFSHNDDKALESSFLQNAAKKVQRNIQNVEDYSRSRVQSDDFWLQTHPRDTVIGRLASNAGEVVASLPLYEALGAEGVTGAAAKAAGRYIPLTEKLAATPVGKFVAKRLISGTGVYLATLGATGGNQKEAAVAAVSGEVLGTAMERIASAPLIKKWTANTIAMGGKPFAQDIVQSSFQEEEHAVAVAEGAKETPSAALQVQRKATDPVMRDLHTAEKVSLNSIARTLYGKPLRGISQKQRLNVLAHRLGQVEDAAREAPAHLPDLTHAEEEHSIEAERKANPVLHDLMSQDEKMFGTKFADVSAENVITIVQKETGISNSPAAARKVRRATNDTAESAYSEPLGQVGKISEKTKATLLKDKKSRIPRLIQIGLADNEEEAMKWLSNPKREERMLRNIARREALSRVIDEHRGKVAEVVAEHHKATSKFTGITSLPEPAEEQWFGKTLEGNTATKGADITPKDFAKHNQESVAYLRAPRDRSEVDFINSRSKDAYDKTYQFLKQADGGFFKAERPVQRFLYHYANKAMLPQGIRQSILHWVKQTPEFQGKTEAEIFKSAKQIHVHMFDMAKSGHLKREGNVYASTMFKGIPKGTKWQKMLSDESDQEAVKGAQKALARHPEALKGFNTTVKALQNKAFKSNNPEDIQAFKDALDKAARAIKMHISRGSAKIGEID